MEDYFKVGHLVPKVSVRGFDSKELNPDKVIHLNNNKEEISNYVKNI